VSCIAATPGLVCKHMRASLACPRAHGRELEDSQRLKRQVSVAPPSPSHNARLLLLDATEQVNYLQVSLPCALEVTILLRSFTAHDEPGSTFWRLARQPRDKQFHKSLEWQQAAGRMQWCPSGVGFHGG